MNEIEKALKELHFKWLPKHLNHIAENIVFNKRNISFLSINYLFRNKNYEILESKEQFENSFIITGFVPTQKNDNLRNKSENLTVIFRLDKHQNIIVITAYSETDDK